jgi:putative ABC transport system substrate-binding protein
MFISGLIVLLAVAVHIVPLAVEAQPAGKVHRIGFLRFGPAPPTWIESFRQGLREFGRVEGQNITIEYAVARSLAQLPDVAAELVRLKVDVLVASGTPSVLPAKNATSTIPVVFVASIDPIATGVVPSLARPGGNVTGVTSMYAEAVGKRLQLLEELLPKLSRIAVLARDHPDQAQRGREAELAARTLGVQLQVLRVRDPRDFEGAFNAARGASALLQLDDALFTANRTQVAELALKNRLPTMVGHRELVEAGGLLAYGADYEYLYRRAATFVDKILKGAKPADLPVEQPTKFELVVNMKTARALGLTIPQSLLLRADHVIE